MEDRAENIDWQKNSDKWRHRLHDHIALSKEHDVVALAYFKDKAIIVFVTGCLLGFAAGWMVFG